ncbi:MAG: hypothetical protein QXM75_00635 [Candidatus Diapherotrites archaeon]
MDILMLAVTVVLMMLFMQYNQFWLVLGILLVMVLTSRSFSTTFVLLLAFFLIYLTKDFLKELWLAITIFVIVLALSLSFRKEERQEYPPDMAGFGGPLDQGGFGM